MYVNYSRKTPALKSFWGDNTNFTICVTVKITCVYAVDSGEVQRLFCPLYVTSRSNEEARLLGDSPAVALGSLRQMTDGDMRKKSVVRNRKRNLNIVTIQKIRAFIYRSGRHMLPRHVLRHSAPLSRRWLVTHRPSVPIMGFIPTDSTDPFHSLIISRGPLSSGCAATSSCPLTGVRDRELVPAYVSGLSR
jgi:hypothetical protein